MRVVIRSGVKIERRPDINAKAIFFFNITWTPDLFILTIFPIVITIIW